MSGLAGTWSSRLISVGCAIVIIAGSFAISGHSSAHGGKPKVHPVPGGLVATPTPSTGVNVHATSTAGSPPRGAQSSAPTASSTPSASSAPTASSAPAASTAGPTTSGTKSSTPQLPSGVLGTFSYATTGHEGTSIPGTSRSYPATTTIKNSLYGCGVLSTWKPISEHVQSQELCPDGTSLKVHSYKTTISFFGVESSESFTCKGDSFIYQPGVAAGHVWKYRCKSPDSVASQKAHVLGYSTMSVGGKSIRVLHVRINTTLTGSDSGKSTQEYWIATSKPVLIKEIGTVTATQQGVHYSETYSLTLRSLSPKT